ncbi:MAG: hypothetical protein Q8K64_06065 [Sediminibacterium sp.]|nr:MAG: hypothetical protein FD183_1311 [Chitinophagaceae bacterium]MDP1842969.1 hypothetical protein [Sediminibacterium sp.]
MKLTLLSLSFFLFSSSLLAQNNWFKLYEDSTSLVNDGKSITAAFTKDIHNIKSTLSFNVNTRLNTTPYLIFYWGENGERTANLPKWDQVIEPQKQFFYEVAGNEADGKKLFGLFFNGFYLPHELGHAVEHYTKGNLKGSYKEEYFANIVAMLWWKKQGRTEELKSCYEMAKKVWAKLPNPIPAGSTMEEYFTKNYEQATQDPYVYGYMQFKQFIMIYEDKSLKDFDSFMINYFQ